MKHLHIVSRVARASLKGDEVVKECTPAKESAGKCEDDIT